MRELHRQGYDELNQPAKAALLEILADRVRLADDVGPLMVELHRYVASLFRCFMGEAKELEIPTMLDAAEGGQAPISPSRNWGQAPALTPDS